MKIKVSKILFVLLLLLPPAIYSTYNVHAQGKYVFVSKSKMDSSKEFLLQSNNFNSPEMKIYLIERIELSEILPSEKIKEIKEKLDYVLFFFVEQDLYDSFGNAILRIWIPFKPKNYVKNSGEMFLFHVVNYAEET